MMLMKLAHLYIIVYISIASYILNKNIYLNQNVCKNNLLFLDQDRENSSDSEIVVVHEIVQTMQMTLHESRTFDISSGLETEITNTQGNIVT